MPSHQAQTVRKRYKKGRFITLKNTETPINTDTTTPKLVPGRHQHTSAVVPSAAAYSQRSSTDRQRHEVLTSIKMQNFSCSANCLLSEKYIILQHEKASAAKTLTHYAPTACILTMIKRILKHTGYDDKPGIEGIINRRCIISFLVLTFTELLSMLKSKCFDHYFHFKLRFYIQGWMFGDF